MARCREAQRAALPRAFPGNLPFSLSCCRLLRGRAGCDEAALRMSGMRGRWVRRVLQGAGLALLSLLPVLFLALQSSEVARSSAHEWGRAASLHALLWPAREPQAQRCLLPLLREANDVFLRHALLSRTARGITPQNATSPDALVATWLVPLYTCLDARVLASSADVDIVACHALLPGKEGLRPGPGQGNGSVVVLGSGAGLSVAKIVYAQTGTQALVFNASAEGLLLPPTNRTPAAPLTALPPVPLDPERGPEPSADSPENISDFQLFLQQQFVPLLRVDCGGCERSLVRHLTATTLPPSVGQISLRLHSLSLASSAAMLMLGLEALGFRLFHAQAPGDAALDSYELGFVHTSLVALPAWEHAAAGDGQSQLRTLLLGREPDWGPVDPKTLCPMPPGRLHRSTAPAEGPAASPGTQPKLSPLRLLSPGSVAESLQPPCLIKERFGWWDSGGVWVCRRFIGGTRGSRSGGTVAAVVTVGGNSNFAGSRVIGAEEALASALHGQAHVFNPALPEAHHKPNRDRLPVVYHDVWVTEESAILPSLRLAVSLEAMLGRTGSTGAHVLRVDCEGCEHGLLRDLARLYNATHMPFQQVCVQVHGVHNVRWMATLVSALEGLGFRMFHAQQDGYDRDVYDLSFIHLEGND